MGQKTPSNGISAACSTCWRSLGRSYFNRYSLASLQRFSPGHHLAAVHAQAAHQFVAQLHSALVGIHGQDDFRLVIEVRLHEAVQPLKVRASGSVGYGHHFFQSCGYQAEGIYLALR